MPDSTLPPLGSLIALHLNITYEGLWGWRLKTSHRHEGEDLSCPYKPVYESLSTEELIDVVEAHTACVNDRFVWDGDAGRCRPDPK